MVAVRADKLMNSFDNKTIWVTGGAGYLGSVIAEALDDAGANVLCFDIDGRAKAFVKENKTSAHAWDRF